MKIKFIVTGCPGKKIYLNPVYLIIKSYYVFKGKYNDKIEWFDTIYDPALNAEDLLEIIKKEKIDILCLSMYVWNKRVLMHLAKLIKENLPNTIIIAGGPELDANRNPDFFKIYSDIDYVVYGDGEEAFMSIVDSTIENKEVANAVNIVTPTKKFPHKVFRDSEFAEMSPWLMLKDEVKAVVEKYGKENVLVYYEMARGCPYSCSFCDWNNGLHNKVTRRKTNWKEDIDFFAELGTDVKLVDANWGIYKEDLDIHKYAVSKLNFEVDSLTKLNKKVAYEIMSLTYQRYSGGRFIIALQDLNETVLKNIDRPSIPWYEHKKEIMALKNKHPDIPLRAELIVGLPGQTIETWCETLCEIESTGIKIVEPNLWMVLPGSPGATESYQNRFKLKSQTLTVLLKEFNNYDEIQNNLSLYLPDCFNTNLIIENYSSSFHEILTNFSLGSIYNILHKRFNKIRNFKSLLHRLRPNIERQCLNFADTILDNKILGVELNNKVIPFELYYYFNPLKDLLK